MTPEEAAKRLHEITGSGFDPKTLAGCLGQDIAPGTVEAYARRFKVRKPRQKVPDADNPLTAPFPKDKRIRDYAKMG